MIIFLHKRSVYRRSKSRSFSGMLFESRAYAYYHYQFGGVSKPWPMMVSRSGVGDGILFFSLSRSDSNLSWSWSPFIELNNLKKAGI